MSLMCMPMLFINMGGEMAYILQQRLQAQNVGKDKSAKVLSEILCTMFNKRFVEEIFKPQEVYSRRAMRTFFEKLAHSSIMRLNETSMDKLYDLMTMAFKYQLQLCTEPSHIILISINHLEGIRNILPDDEVLLELLESAHQKLLVTYQGMQRWELALIRSCLLTFFQDARVKVSLLLRENKQMDDGRFLLFPNNTVELVMNGNAPGNIRYFEGGEVIRAETFPSGDRPFEYKPTPAKVNYQLRAADRGTVLGNNMYTSPDSTQVKGGGGLVKADAPPVGDELRLLSTLITPADGSSKKGFKLSLFNDDDEERVFAEETEKGISNVKRIEAAQESKPLVKALAELDLKVSTEKPKKKEKKGEDMLELLDEAAQRPVTAKKTTSKVRSRSGSAKGGVRARSGSAKKKT